MSDSRGSRAPAIDAADARRHLFQPGQSGNPGGRPKSERKLLAELYGEDGAKVFRRLEELRADPHTPRRLKAQIDFFLVERLFGKPPQLLGVEGGPSLVSLLADVAVRTAIQKSEPS